MDSKRLCELTSAADSLQLKPLVDLTSRALARVIEGKTPEEIREIFHLPDDLTEVSGAWENCVCLASCLSFVYNNIDSILQEEKLEPLKNTTDDPRIRLLNRLYAKKRKELKDREKLKVAVVFSFSVHLHLMFSSSLHLDLNFHKKLNACILLMLYIELIGRVLT